MSEKASVCTLVHDAIHTRSAHSSCIAPPPFPLLPHPPPLPRPGLGRTWQPLRLAVPIHHTAPSFPFSFASTALTGTPCLPPPRYTEFVVQGSGAEVHLAGYLSPHMGEEDDEDEDEEGMLPSEACVLRLCSCCEDCVLRLCSCCEGDVLCLCS